jgi:BirA family biotin operon repressor/biotin-[acetyl-CoA-carboxylase] ligase
LPGFTNVVRLDVVDSTNRYAADAVRRGAPEGLVVVAEEQSAGRGRLGRSWVAPRGSSLLCSIVLRPRVRPDELHLVSTAVALAAADAAQGTSGAPIDLKWPNDLVAGDDKVGGILAEVVATGVETPAVVVGVGVNLEASGVRARLVRAGKEDEPVPVTGLAELAGHAVARDDVLAALLEFLRRRLSAPRRPGRSTMDEYRRRCATIGRPVRVDTAGRSFFGLVLGIDDAGRLVVESDGERLVLDAADVVHLRDDRRSARRGNRGP